MGKVKLWSVEKKNEIKNILISMWASLAMDIPDNYEEIVQFVYEDVCETADPEAWHSGDVAIGFRRWIESQTKENVQPNAIPDIGETIHTVKDLKAFLSTLKDDDQVVLEAIDLETGDVQDLYPFHMDVINGIELTDGRTVSEIRFCQEKNTEEPVVIIPEVLRSIDWELLKKQKQTLLKVINSEDNDSVLDDLDGILNLIDYFQDYAVDNCKLDENLVFNLHDDDITRLLCATCNSDNLDLTQTRPYMPEDDKPKEVWCNDCQNFHPTYEATFESDKYKVEGFQVLSDDDDGNIHPLMAGSFCLYNLSQARKMIAQDYNKWRLLTIWTGDVEEPTYMFKGDPRK